MKILPNIMPVIGRLEIITLFNQETDKILPTGTDILGRFRILTNIAGKLEKKSYFIRPEHKISQLLY